MRGLIHKEAEPPSPAANAPGEELVAWSSIRVDGGTQSRADGLDEQVVTDYAEAMGSGAKFPLPEVLFDGTEYWLWDGFHRYAAHAIAHGEDAPIQVNIKPGTQRDAQLASKGANAKHGLPRTDEDKRQAVDELLADEEWGQWGDREIARRTLTTHPFVAKRRKKLAKSTGNVTSLRKFTDSAGNERVMETANIGAASTEREPKEPPPAGTGEAAGDGPSPPPTLDELISEVWSQVKKLARPPKGDQQNLDAIGWLRSWTLLDGMGLPTDEEHKKIATEALRVVRSELKFCIEQAQRDQAAAASSHVADLEDTGSPAEAGHGQTIDYTASDEQPETPSLHAARLVNGWPHESIMLTFTKTELLLLLNDADVVNAVIEQLGDG